jgi:ribosomal protein S20
MEKTLSEKKILATAAKDLLENDVYASAFKDIEEQYFASIKKSKLKHSVEREKLYLAIHALEDVKNQLRQYVSDFAYEMEKQK